MDKKEIRTTIKQLKREIKLFQEIAERMNFPKDEIEAQINKYLDTLNSLLEELKK